MMEFKKDYNAYKIIRPLPNVTLYTKDNIPIIRKDKFDINDWEETSICNLQNSIYLKERNNVILMFFNNDEILERIRNDPYKYMKRFLNFKAICTPDFSAYINMNPNDIKYNVYRNRWLGCLYQSIGFKVIPTIQWSLPNTYDFCFQGVEKGSIVIISTLGCKKAKKVFLEGFNEMKKRICPELIIVYGDFIDGMTGRFLLFN